MDRLQTMRMFVFDVDGIFTDGRSWQNAKGEFRRVFSIRDTLAIKALRRSGYLVAVVTEVESKDVSSHMQQIGLDAFSEGCLDKSLELHRLARVFGLKLDQIVFVSEDMRDLPAMQMVGGRITTTTAHQSLRSVANFVTNYGGGEGAVLEICQQILNGSIRGQRTRGLTGVS